MICPICNLEMELLPAENYNPNTYKCNNEHQIDDIGIGWIKYTEDNWLYILLIEHKHPAILICDAFFKSGNYPTQHHRLSTEFSKENLNDKVQELIDSVEELEIFQ
jgi:hypothetical protein